MLGGAFASCCVLLFFSSSYSTAQGGGLALFKQSFDAFPSMRNFNIEDMVSELRLGLDDLSAIRINIKQPANMSSTMLLFFFASLALFSTMFLGIVGIPQVNYSATTTAAKTKKAATTATTTTTPTPMKTTQLFYRGTTTNRIICNRLRTQLGDYTPPWWYVNHLGATIAFGHDPPIEYERQLFEDAQKRVAVDWYPCQPPAAADDDAASSCCEAVNIVIVFPGLGLSSANKFCKKFVEYMASSTTTTSTSRDEEAGNEEDENPSNKNGRSCSSGTTSKYYCAVLNARGVSDDNPLKSANLWHPGRTDDAEELLTFIHSKYGGKANIFLVGFSAGTNLVKLLVHKPDRVVPLRGVFFVTYTSSYVKNRGDLESTFVGRIYSRLMCDIFKSIVLKNKHVHPTLGGEQVLKELEACSTLTEYDHFAFEHLYYSYNAENAKEQKLYRSLEHYHEVLSGGVRSELPFAKHVPSLVIQPKDDPLHVGEVRNHIDIADVVNSKNSIYVMATTLYLCLKNRSPTRHTLPRTLPRTYAFHPLTHSLPPSLTRQLFRTLFFLLSQRWKHCMATISDFSRGLS